MEKFLIKKYEQQWFFYFEYDKWKAENSVGLDRLLE